MTAERTCGGVASEGTSQKARSTTADPDSTTIVYSDVSTRSSMWTTQRTRGGVARERAAEKARIATADQNGTAIACKAVRKY
jgi:hypothetical protein